MKRLICLKVFSLNTLTECDSAWMEAPLQRRETLRSLTEVVITKKPPVQDTKRELWRCSSFMKPDQRLQPFKAFNWLIATFDTETYWRKTITRRRILSDKMRTSLHNRAVVNQRKPWTAKIEKKKKKKNFDELIGWRAGGVRAGS